jgi:hypothetical protein
LPKDRWRAGHPGVQGKWKTGDLESDGRAAACRILGLDADQMAGRSSLNPRWRSVHEDGSSFPGDAHPAMATLRTGQPSRGVVMGAPASVRRIAHDRHTPRPLKPGTDLSS